VLLVLAAPSVTAGADAPPNLEVDRLVDEALRHNPEILAAQEKAEAARQKIPQASALEDPMLGVGVTNLPTNFSFEDDDMTQKEVSITQKLPFPGKRGLMRAMAERDAEAAAIDIEETRSRVVRDVKSAYYELSHVYRTADVTQRNKQIIESLVRIAEARYSLGEGIQQELLAAQVEISRMLDELLMLDQNRFAAEAKLEGLLNREVTGALGRPAVLHFKRVPVDSRRLQQDAVESNPALKRMRKMIEARRKGVEVAERDVFPDFELRVSYGQRDDGPGGENRRDMVSGMIGVNIPIFYGSRQGPRIAESRAELHSTEARYSAMRNEVAAMVAGMAAMVQRLERQVALYESGILPQARLQAQSALSAYTVNRIEFAGLLESHIRLHRYELDYHQALTDYEKNLALLEAAVGARVGEVN
jgi:outer membrane protein TolC